VELRREDGELVVRVTNDGAVPESPHDETGGLANLRTAIERANGTMLVEWTPSFALTARLTEEM
jgi:signal transduction histidine kinase